MPDSQRGAQQQGAGNSSAADVKDKARQAVGQAQDAAKPVVDQVKQKAEQLAQQAKESYEPAREAALSGYRQAEGTIARNPVPSMLIGFGVGFGLGVVITSLLTQKEETWSEKYLPESLQNVPDHYDSLVESLKSLPKSVHQQLPRSISKFLS